MSCSTPANPPLSRRAGVGRDWFMFWGDGGGLTQSAIRRGVELSQINDVGLVTLPGDGIGELRGVMDGLRDPLCNVDLSILRWRFQCRSLWDKIAFGKRPPCSSGIAIRLDSRSWCRWYVPAMLCISMFPSGFCYPLRKHSLRFLSCCHLRNWNQRNLRQYRRSSKTMIWFGIAPTIPRWILMKWRL